MSRQIVFFKENMTDVLQLLSIKEPQAMLQNKQATVYTKLYQKMSNQNTKKNPGIKCALFSCKGEKGMDNFGYLNSSYYFTFIL